MTVCSSTEVGRLHMPWIDSQIHALRVTRKRINNLREADAQTVSTRLVHEFE